MKRECILLLLSIFTYAVKAQFGIYDGLYFGVGVGVLAVAIAMVVGIVFCFIRNCTSMPE